MSPFSDPETVARYAEGPVRQVPGFHDLQRMTGLLLAERVQNDGHVLVLGAGGGLELKAFAETQPGWRFCGVDPSAEMLGLAERTLGPLASRVDFHRGYRQRAGGSFRRGNVPSNPALRSRGGAPTHRSRCPSAIEARYSSSSPTTAFHSMTGKR